MARRRTSDPVSELREIALRYPEVEEGITCDKAAFKARKKAFLFIGTTGDSVNVMLKLRESLPDAGKLAAAEASRYKVGASGWVTIVFDRGKAPPLDMLEKWIEESFSLLAPKTLVATLGEAGPADKKAAAGVKERSKRTRSSSL